MQPTLLREWVNEENQTCQLVHVGPTYGFIVDGVLQEQGRLRNQELTGRSGISLNTLYFEPVQHTNLPPEPSQ